MGYIDPGALGIVAQIGYIVAFVLASVFLFLSRPLRKVFARLRGRRTDRSCEARPATDNVPTPAEERSPCEGQNEQRRS